MKSNFTLSAVALAFVFGLSSCEKEKDAAPEPSKAEIIAGKNWKMTAITVNGQDTYSAYDACDRDDIYIFSKYSKYTIKEGATKCDPSNPDSIEGTWSINGNKLIITEDGLSLAINADILQLDTKTLKYSFDEIVLGTGKYVVTYTAQ